MEGRKVKVYPVNLSKERRKKWNSVRSIIQVHRQVKEKGETREETAYFISDLPSTTPAKYFYEGTREHWHIESFHYIKDVVFLEDKWKVRTKNAPGNYSLIRNMVINIFRQHEFESIQATIEKCANNVPFMMGLF